jgi:hypothetical protein
MSYRQPGKSGPVSFRERVLVLLHQHLIVVYRVPGLMERRNVSVQTQTRRQRIEFRQGLKKPFVDRRRRKRGDRWIVVICGEGNESFALVECLVDIDMLAQEGRSIMSANMNDVQEAIWRSPIHITILRLFKRLPGHWHPSVNDSTRRSERQVTIVHTRRYCRRGKGRQDIPTKVQSE